MDKTILNGINRKIDNDNYTESFLCDEIHDNMKMLAFFHPFSDDLKNCFTKVRRKGKIHFECILCKGRFNKN